MFLFSLIELCFPSGAQKECAEGLFLYSDHVLNTNITSDSSKKKLKKKCCQQLSVMQIVYRRHLYALYILNSYFRHSILFF